MQVCSTSASLLAETDFQHANIQLLISWFRRVYLIVAAKNPPCPRAYSRGLSKEMFPANNQICFPPIF